MHISFTSSEAFQIEINMTSSDRFCFNYIEEAQESTDKNKIDYPYLQSKLSDFLKLSLSLSLYVKKKILFGWLLSFKIKKYFLS